MYPIRPSRREWIDEVGIEPAKISFQLARRWPLPDPGEHGTTHPPTTSRGMEFGHRSAGNSHSETLAAFDSSQNLPDVVAELLLRNHVHSTTVALLLPSPILERARPGPNGSLQNH